jgi:hypothetical protein
MTANLPSLSDVAPTLADLKRIPLEQKCRLLLARLARIGQNDSALNKHNLMMRGDPFALAHGYSEAEKTAVREHLLGAPWTRLVNEGYLADFLGQGFFKVTEEGKEYLAQGEALPAYSLSPAQKPKSTAGVPRALLSYSWEGREHRDWVLECAVADNDFVVVVCTPAYAERANKREGGVGYESMVITAELAEHMITNKFIPVLRKGEWGESLPTYLKGRMGVNLSNEPYDEDEYEQLLRALHGDPIQPPPLGKKPDFSKRASKDKLSVVEDGPGASSTNTGPANKRPNAIVWSSYDKPGVSAPRVLLIVRPWNIDGKEQYSFETTRGDEYIGTKDEVIDRCFSFHRSLLKEGYKRMNFVQAGGPDFNVLN